MELGIAERAAVDEEAFNLAAALGKRLAQDGRTAFRGRALAGVAGAGPVDIAGDDTAAGRCGQLRRNKTPRPPGGREKAASRAKGKERRGRMTVDPLFRLRAEN